jgi:hypothetical protein
MSNSGPPSYQLIQFCDLLDKNEELQLQIKAAATPKEIIEIAESNGCKLSLKELRFWSKELKAKYFPWSEMGNEWRRNFFS